MAKIKCTIMIEAKFENSFLLYIPKELIPEVERIEGIKSIIELVNVWHVSVDPRYDIDEVVDEIYALDTPIPSAFTDAE